MHETDSHNSKPQLLCEGAEGAFAPEVLYVQQGDRVLFFNGKQDLSESVDDGATIVESLDDLELEEKQAGDHTVTTVKDGRWVFETVFQRADVQNQNGRIYPRKIWDNLIANEDSEVQQRIKNRAMVGHLEHPTDGKDNGKEGAIVTTENKLLEDGTVWGKGEILDTPNGRILQEYTQKNIPWGVSSRGNGTVNNDGEVQEDYRLRTYDAVMNPSTPGAYATGPNTEGRAGKQESVEETGEEPDHQAAQQLVEDIESLDESWDTTADRASMIRQMLGRFSEVDRHRKSGALSSDKAQDLQEKIVQALNARPQSEIDSDLVESFREAAERDSAQGVDDEDDEPHRTEGGDTSRLESKLAKLENRVAELKSELARAHEQAEAFRHERDRAWEEIEQVESQRYATEQKLEIAHEQIERLQEQPSQVTAVEAAVEEKIEAHPELAKYREQLRQADTVTEVFDTVSNLAPSALTEAAEPPASRKRNPGTLPQGKVVSESVSGPPKPKAGRNASKGARSAAAAVGKK